MSYCLMHLLNYTFNHISECALLVKNVSCKPVCQVTVAAASCVLCISCVLLASPSLVLDLILCCFVQ